MRPINAEKNALDATKALLDFSKVRATKLGLKEALEQHPDFPSMNSLSDVLNNWQIPNLAARLTPDRLHEIPLPALTYLTIDGGIFATLRSVNGNVKWLHTERGWQEESIGQFSQKWSGVTLLIEPTEQSGEREYIQNRHRAFLRFLRIPFIFGGLLVVLALLANWVKYPMTRYALYYLPGLLKLMGTVVSAMLVWYSLDTNNAFLQKVCQLNGRTNCQNILSSSAAKLTDWLSWAEVGLFYFAGGLLVWGIGLLTGDAAYVQILYLLTVLALPYSIWSVYYQARVAREWCVLCLTVQGLFWAEFVVGYLLHDWPTLTPIVSISIDRLSVFLISFVVIPLLWAWIKPALQKTTRYKPLLREFQKLKYDPHYLNGLLSNPRILPPLFKDMQTISLGNPAAENTLIMVISPTCTACRRNHLALEKVMEMYTNLYVQIVLAASPHTEDTAGRVAGRLLTIPIEQRARALDDWFALGEARFAQWSRAYPPTETNEESTQQLRLHLRWMELAGVMQAPTSFLNAVELPRFFLPNELPRLCASFTNLGIGQFK
ncbi:vitamin K epoxide reductase family protein [Arundinibacter roseus]|uniref:Peptidase C39 bacteriocin processing n=1 Tax=Arundinibacter roseus TaxID=2070510 RepID=A0A4V2X802_9BACT|nr:vitamin K epoxide reductase family protein [Arundinibacter roseus]TDB57955.1 peptidase C39 bacteriocin processing [Arundinibacter roseus]